jgi:hypothetical protein
MANLLVDRTDGAYVFDVANKTPLESAAGIASEVEIIGEVARVLHLTRLPPVFQDLGINLFIELVR